MEASLWLNSSQLRVMLVMRSQKQLGNAALEYQICINPQLKGFPNKTTNSLFLSNIC